MSLRIRSGATGSVIAAIASAVILLLAASLASLSSANADTVTPDPTTTATVTDTVTATPTDSTSPTPTDTATPTPTPTDTVTPTPTDTVTPTPTDTTSPTPTPDPTPVPGFATQSFSLADGRTYYARIPTCTPLEAPECTAYLGQKRQVLIFLHGYNGMEDPATAQQFLDLFGMSRKKQADTIFVYAVSKDGLRAWNADLCCTFDKSTGVDDVGYLVNVVADLPTRTATNTSRVGLFGWSNGGMLALKADCTRPDVFDFGSSWAGTWVGPCGKAGAKVMYMHGSADTTVPVNGGRTYVADHWIDVPPASDLAAYLVKGNNYPITMYTGIGHQITLALQTTQLNWAFANLR